MTNFYGWRIGQDLTDEQADQLEPIVDQFAYALEQAKMYLSYESLETQNDHILRIMTVLGQAAEDTHHINKTFSKPTEGDTEQLTDNQKKELVVFAQSLLKSMVDVSALALLSAAMVNDFIGSLEE